ncbi:MAG TPA: MFS transporter, partial [Chloroflexota bacterium]
LGVFILFGGSFFLPQYLQLVLGFSPLEAATWSLPWALAAIVGSIATPRLIGRVQRAHLMAGGLALASIGFALLTRLDASVGLALLVPASVAFSLGVAPLFTLTNELVIGSVPPERAGAASGVSETCAELGAALGIAVFGSVGVAVYRSAMADAMPSVPAEAIEGARETLGAAVAIAAQIPDQIGAPLLQTARRAFVQGLQVSAAISAVGSLGLAIFTMRALRGARPASEAEALSVDPPQA